MTHPTDTRALVEQLGKALFVAITQNECDMLMTGEELRQCNAALTAATEYLKQPQGDVEPPVAWFAFAESNGLVPLELYGWDEKACKYAVLMNARSVGWKGTVEGYLLTQGWTVKPVYAHPQATEQPQGEATRTLMDVTLDDDDALAYLRDMVVQADGDLTAIRLLFGDGHSGYGLYIASADYPEEGAILLAKATSITPQATEPAPSTAGEADPDDSLLICVSDLEHSAIYDNHREMQSCIRAVAQRIKALATQPAQGERAEVIEDLLMYAGDNGYGHIDYADTMRRAAALLQSAPSQTERALTEKEIMGVAPGMLDCLSDPYDAAKNGDCYSSIPIDMVRFARAIERAHGIGGQQ